MLQDRLKYEVFDKIKEERIAQIITGKVQDAILKKEAALAIQQTYAEIINVMKKVSTENIHALASNCLFSGCFIF